MLPHRRRHFWSLNYYIFTCKIIRMNNVIFSLCAHLLFFSFLFYFLFRFFPCNSLNIFFPPGWPWLLHFLFVIGSCLTLLHPSSFVRLFVCLFVIYSLDIRSLSEPSKKGNSNPHSLCTAHRVWKVVFLWYRMIFYMLLAMSTPPLRFLQLSIPSFLCSFLSLDQKPSRDGVDL